MISQIRGRTQCGGGREKLAEGNTAAGAEEVAGTSEVELADFSGNVCFLKVPVRISARTPTMRTKLLPGIPQIFKANTEILP